ncbi:hypothetical protein N9L70_01450 [Rhodobacteraceae bacterium]|nr:hypothetical protein [Paracoccaceae bacterium]
MRKYLGLVLLALTGCMNDDIGVIKDDKSTVIIYLQGTYNHYQTKQARAALFYQGDPNDLDSFFDSSILLKPGYNILKLVPERKYTLARLMHSGYYIVPCDNAKEPSFITPKADQIAYAYHLNFEFNTDLFKPAFTDISVNKKSVKKLQREKELSQFAEQTILDLDITENNAFTTCAEAKSKAENANYSYIYLNKW